jgi:hypothetical protein
MIVNESIQPIHHEERELVDHPMLLLAEAIECNLLADFLVERVRGTALCNTNERAIIAVSVHELLDNIGAIQYQIQLGIVTAISEHAV